MGARWLLILMLMLGGTLAGCTTLSAEETDPGASRPAGEQDTATTDDGGEAGKEESDEEPVIPADPDC